MQKKNKNDTPSRSESSVALSVLASALDVDRHEDGDRGPDHDDEEEKRISDVASRVRDKPYD